MKKERFKRLFSYLAMKRPNKPRPNAPPTTKFDPNTWTKWSRRIAWRIRLSISRRHLLKWKYKRKRSANLRSASNTSSRKWLRRRLFVVKRKKKSCRWSSWKWSLSKNYRTPRPSKKRPISSWRMPFVNHPPWWLLTWTRAVLQRPQLLLNKNKTTSDQFITSDNGEDVTRAPVCYQLFS